MTHVSDPPLSAQKPSPIAVDSRVRRCRGNDAIGTVILLVRGRALVLWDRGPVRTTKVRVQDLVPV